jgi:hypothetical protein
MSTSDMHIPRSLHSPKSLLIIPRCLLAAKYEGMNENKSSEPKETKATKWQISRHLQSKTLRNVVLFHKKTRQLTNNQHRLARSVHRQPNSRGGKVGRRAPSIVTRYSKNPPRSRRGRRWRGLGRRSSRRGERVG